CGHDMWLLASMESKLGQGIGVDPDLDIPSSGRLVARKGAADDVLPTLDAESADRIIMLAVLEHIPPDTVGGLLREVRRVLKTDGSLVLTTPTPASKPLLEFLAFRLRVISRPEIEDHKKYYDRHAIDEVASSAGMRVVTYKKFQFGLNSLAEVTPA
ncbi:MAG: methyltransferase domain-containing protein, partial [Acidimicrobiia bacterium]